MINYCRNVYENIYAMYRGEIKSEEINRLNNVY